MCYSLRVAEHIFSNYIKRMLKNKTVILVTHGLQVQVSSGLRIRIRLLRAWKPDRIFKEQKTFLLQFLNQCDMVLIISTVVPCNISLFFPVPVPESV